MALLPVSVVESGRSTPHPLIKSSGKKSIAGKDTFNIGGCPRADSFAPDDSISFAYERVSLTRLPTGRQ